MYSSSMLGIYGILSCIINLLGCWQIQESAKYSIDKDGVLHLICWDVANVPPIISFLYDGKGIVGYCNGKTISFDWHAKTDSTVNIILFSDSIENHTINIMNSNGRMVFSENKSNNILYRYVLNANHYTIEDLNDNIEAIILNWEYDYLKKKNLYPHLRCIIAKGYENNNRLQIGGQEYLEIVHGQPNTQSVLCVISTRHQHIIPYYLVTYDERGDVYSTQFVEYIDRLTGTD